MTTATPHPSSRHSRGFTLAEAIIVIVITGILAAMTAVFIRAPVKAYFDVANRAELTDVADTALRRAARDIRAALPNSVRIAGTCDGVATCFVEFTPIKSAGRYRDGAPGNPLDFNAAADTFDVVTPTGVGVDVASGDSIVIYNLGITGSDVYAGTDRRLAVAPFGSALIATGYTGGTFPLSSPAKRFQVVGTPVTFACNGAGQMQRYSGYAFAASQPQPPAGTPAVLATNVTRCRFAYQTVNQLNALVTLDLGLTRNGESVNLVHQIHVNNAP